MSRSVIYTSISGDYDTLYEPTGEFRDIDFVCFTDNPNVSSKRWEIRSLPKTIKNPILASRHPKILPHMYFPDHETSIYIDGNFEPQRSIDELLEKYLADKPILLFRHPRRDCAYKEIEECLRVAKGNPDILIAQRESYLGAGFPFSFGLYEAGVMVRKHHASKVAEAMEAWWQQFEKFCGRDQVSLPYALWQTGLVPTVVSTTVRDTFFFSRQHRKEGSRALRQDMHNRLIAYAPYRWVYSLFRKIKTLKRVSRIRKHEEGKTI
ncbi:MAG: glycosyltransferase domain-containing protein [Campylobacterales bacterium]